MRTKDNTCCFTGHRDISIASYSELVHRVEPLIMSLIDNGYKYFICGGAIGFDTFAATYICSLKMRGFKVNLVLMLPCKNQNAKWSEYDKLVYNHILDRADEVIYVSEKYHSGCMHARNRALVDASSACICYLSSNTGGTKYTVDYAIENGLSVINIAKP